MHFIFPSTRQSLDNLDEEEWKCQENCPSEQLTIVQLALTKQFPFTVGLTDLGHAVEVIGSPRGNFTGMFSPANKKMARSATFVR